MIKKAILILLIFSMILVDVRAGIFGNKPSIYRNIGNTVITIAASDSMNKQSADYVCDGTADEEVINAIVTKLATAGSGTVQFIDGTYDIATSVVLKSNVVLSGQGMETVLKVSGDYDVITGDTLSNVTIKNLLVDGDRTNRTTAVSGIMLDTVDGIVIQNVSTKDCKNAGIELNTCTNFTINNFTDTGSRVYGFYAIDSDNGTIDGFRLSNTFYGFFLHDCDYVVVTNGDITNNHNEAFVIYKKTDGSGCDTVTVSNVNVHDSTVQYIDGASYTDSDKHIAKAATDWSNFEVGQSVYVGETSNGQITDGIYYILTVGETHVTVTTDGINAADLGSDSAGDVFIYLENWGGHVGYSNNVNFLNCSFDCYGIGLRVQNCTNVAFTNTVFKSIAKHGTSSATAPGYGLYTSDNVGMTINGCSFNNNDSYGLYEYHSAGALVSNSVFSTNASGGMYLYDSLDINIDNCMVINNTGAGVTFRTVSYMTNVGINNCRIGNISGTAQTYALSVFNVASSLPEGIINVANCNLSGNATGVFYDATNFILNKIRLNNYLGSVAKTSAYTVALTDVGYVLTNNAATGSVTFTLPAAIAGVGPFVIKNVESQAVVIDPAGSETINLAVGGAQQAGGAYITSAGKSACVVFKCYTTGTWSLIDLSGTWTAEE